MLDLDITELLDNINKVSTDDLHRLMNAIKCELPVRENNLSGLVDYIPDFCGDEVLMEALWAECESLPMANTRRKATTQWLSPISDLVCIYGPYIVGTLTLTFSNNSVELKFVYLFIFLKIVWRCDKLN